MLQVDHEVVGEYERERGREEERLGKLVEVMEQKISSSVELYRADPHSIRPFTQNILRMFARLFVAGKATLAQAQRLHQLNCFLLREVGRRDQERVDVGAQLEDLRAQLEAETKMRLFFTDKSIRSEQKALFEEHLRLTQEVREQQLTEGLRGVERERTQLQEENLALVETNRSLDGERVQAVRQWEGLRERHRKLTEELAVLRETVLKMSIL